MHDQGSTQEPVQASLAEVLAELRETEARQRALLSVLPDLMFRLHRDGTYLEFAGDLTRLATPAEELLGSNMHEILPADVAGPLMACAERALETGTLETVEYRLRTLAGELRDFEARIVPVREDEVLTIVRDVTAYRRAEQERREVRARVAAAETAERRRLERNLHDGAQQHLVTANLTLHLAQRDLERDPDAARNALKTASAELAAGLSAIRQLAQGLHPQALAEHGLTGALESLVERTIVPVELAELPEERLPDSVEAVAYYVVAEALANAAKHAGATRVVVTARLRNDELHVEVEDDGRGGADPGGGGLRGLADRVADAAGRLEIESADGTGTRVRAVIPTTALPGGSAADPALH